MKTSPDLLLYGLMWVIPMRWARINAFACCYVNDIFIYFHASSCVLHVMIFE